MAAHWWLAYYFLQTTIVVGFRLQKRKYYEDEELNARNSTDIEEDYEKQSAAELIEELEEKVKRRKEAITWLFVILAIVLIMLDVVSVIELKYTKNTTQTVLVILSLSPVI